jgi:hypothetical protein
VLSSSKILQLARQPIGRHLSTKYFPFHQKPTPIIYVVGITLDTRKFEASLPLKKIEKCRSYLHRFLSRDRCTLKDMQSLVGTLNFACTVVQPGRAFLRIMINLTCKVAEHQQFIFISEEAKLDMKIWLSFLENFNGTSMFIG